MIKRALVTGACGFVGRNMAKYLAEQGFEVVGIGHGQWSQAESSLFGLSRWHSADVSLEALKAYGANPDLIFHCAGSGSVSFSVSHPDLDRERTVTTTRSVLEYIKSFAKNAKLVYPSSAAVYGVTESLPTSEMTKLAPVSPYGENKMLAERICQTYASDFGINIAIVRMFSAYGLGLRKQLLFDACSKIQTNDILFSGTGDETRDWLHINDAAKLLFIAAQKASAVCPIANGGSGTAVTIKEVITEVFKDFGRKDQPHFSGKRRTGDPIHYHADISKARAWGWYPKVRLQDGIQDYVSWFRSGAA